MKKILLLFVLISSFAVMSFNSPINSPIKEDQKIIQTITLKNGKVVTNEFTVDQFKSINCVDDAVWCSYQFADGSCNSVNTSCSAAWSDFAECACEAGHEDLCMMSGPIGQ